MPDCTVIANNPRSPRPGRWDTGWRTLPVVLLERPLGGGWHLQLDGLPAMRVESGQLAVVPAGWRHRLHKPGPDGGMTSCWSMLRWLDDAGLPWPLPAQPIVLAGGAAALIDDFAAGGGTWRDGARRQRAAWRLMELIAARQHAPVERGDPRIRHLLAWLQAHLHRPLSRAELAAQAACSPSRLHDLCVRSLGAAPMQLVARYRIERAQELLLGSDLAMGEIAERCGYASPFWFSRAFRSATGRTPSAYRGENARR